MAIFVLFSYPRRTEKKNSNSTIHYIAHCLTRLAQQGVNLREYHLRRNRDNTARENKNTKTYIFLMCLVGTRRVKEITVSNLRSGHTHELMDQWLGRICQWIWHHERLETPADFVVCVNAFLSQSTDTREPWGHCLKVDEVYDWDAWLSQSNVHVGNIGGPQAVHVFEFIRREGI